MRASFKCLTFSQSKTVISFIILLVLQILSLRNIYFQVSNNICIHKNNQCTFLISLMVLCYYKRQYTDKTVTLRKCMEYMRASFKNFAFSHSNTAISLNILLVLQILCFRNIFNFRCQHSPYIYNQCSFPLLYMVWCYI